MRFVAGLGGAYFLGDFIGTILGFIFGLMLLTAVAFWIAGGSPWWIFAAFALGGILFLCLCIKLIISLTKVIFSDD